MSLLQNELVTLKQIDSDTWQILHEDVEVGIIRTIRTDHDYQIYFEIKEEYRGNHYASNAVYLITPYIHETEGIVNIHACIPVGQEMAGHIVEHDGYQRVSKDSDTLLYTHSFVQTTRDDAYQPDGMEVLYLAGGCFWGMERVFKVLDGVVETRTGYANGNIPNPTYEQVCRNETGYRETVRVTYDPERIDVETVLQAYFMCVDPTTFHQQGEDIGEQYQTGIYYRNKQLLGRIQSVYEAEKKKHEAFYVELQPLQCFYEAEEYHQDYLTKIPDGYCHITLVDLEKVKQLNQKL